MNKVLLGIPSGGSVKTKTMFSIFQVLFQTTDAAITLAERQGALGLLWHDGDGADEAPFKASMDYLYRLREANVIDLVNYDTVFKRFSNPRKAR